MSEKRRSPTSRRPCDAREEIAELIAEMKEEECLSRLHDLLSKGVAPFDLLDWCMEGMRRVGQRYETGHYFMAALVMAGEIMRQATEVLRPQLNQDPSQRLVKGTVLLATVKGDIHDLGKNLFSLLLQCNGFAVDDLGVDVDAAVLLERAGRTSPDIVGISCILTSSLEVLKATVELLKRGLPEPRPPIIIGGCAIDSHVQEFVKADLWAADAARGVELCRICLSRPGG